MERQPTQPREIPSDILSSISGLFAHLLYSPTRGYQVLRLSLLLTLVLAALARIFFSALALQPPFLYLKDIFQDYLGAKAIAAGLDPYLPIDDLAEQLFGTVPVQILPNPTPHPPPALLLGFPLTLFAYETAAVIWYALEITFMGMSAILILKWREIRLTVFSFTLAFSLLAIWHPFMEELCYGQFMSLLLLLLLFMVSFIKKGNYLAAGICLGLGIVLKIMLWPVVLFFLFRKKWTAVLSIALTVLVGNAAGLLAVGWDQALVYYLDVSGMVFDMFRASAVNFSAWTVGYRLFSGTESLVLINIEAPALLQAPEFAPLFSLALVLLLLVAAGWKAYRTQNEDIALGIWVCVSILVSPVAWIHYFTLAVIPLVVLVHHLANKHLSGWQKLLFLVMGILLLIENSHLLRMAFGFAVSPVVQGEPVEVPFLAGLITLLPTVLLVMLLWVLVSLEPPLVSQSGREEELVVDPI